MLNLPGYQSTAAIVAEIEDTSTWEEGKGRNGRSMKNAYAVEPHIMVQFANCDRSISFDFDITTPEERSNSFHKIDTMIDALMSFREGLTIEAQRYKKRQAALKESE
jgi:hypothetical protein